MEGEYLNFEAHSNYMSNRIAKKENFTMSSNAAQSLTPDEALAKLMAGNERYVAARAEHPRGRFR